MKKLLALLVVLVMCFPLGACMSDTKNIEAELEGYWYVQGELFERHYHFADGKYESSLSNFLGSDQSTSGTYTVMKDAIKTLAEGSSDPKYLPYTYNKDSGKLRLYWDEEKTLEIIKGK